jgi:hypothetical protein
MSGNKKIYTVHQAGNLRTTELHLSVCPCCKRTANVQVRRRNTQYANDEANWLLSCNDCFIEDCEQWEERWHELLSSIY